MRFHTLPIITLGEAATVGEFRKLLAPYGDDCPLQRDYDCMLQVVDVYVERLRKDEKGRWERAEDEEPLVSELTEVVVLS